MLTPVVSTEMPWKFTRQQNTISRTHLPIFKHISVKTAKIWPFLARFWPFFKFAHNLPTICPRTWYSQSMFLSSIRSSHNFFRFFGACLRIVLVKNQKTPFLALFLTYTPPHVVVFEFSQQFPLERCFIRQLYGLSPIFRLFGNKS